MIIRNTIFQQIQPFNIFLVVIASTALHWPMLAMTPSNVKIVFYPILPSSNNVSRPTLITSPLTGNLCHKTHPSLATSVLCALWVGQK